MTTFHRAVLNFETKCEERNVPKETVMAYLVEISQRERYNLYANFDQEMPKELEEEFSNGMQRILNQEPMAHVLGYSWFYGYKMIANPTVLIPRYETEELCANVLARIDELFMDEEKIVCADIGTGSGAIAITLVKEESKISMYATDISGEALETAKQNAEMNEADITFLQGDMVQPIIDANIKLDVLVCNPPYIPEDETMEESVIDYEPHVALFGGQDGLKFYRSVFENCKKVLKEKSFMAFEMGWNQRESMEKLLHEYFGDVNYEIMKDINGKDRMLFVYFGCE